MQRDGSGRPRSCPVIELEHGWHRAKTHGIALARRRYLDEVFTVIPVEPFTREMGMLAGKIDAKIKKSGVIIATADLLIAVTALHNGYAIATRNLRHFQKVPGLEVVSF